MHFYVKMFTNIALKKNRVNECMKGSKPPPIRKDIDKGHWFQSKVDKLRMSYILQVMCAVILIKSD